MINGKAATALLRRLVRIGGLGLIVLVAVLGLGLIVLVASFLAPGNSGAAPGAYSSIPDWDVSMSDVVVVTPCPGQPTANDGDGKIEAGECPKVISSFWIQRAGGASGTQSLFDRASVIWTTGPLAGDVTGDGVLDAQHGLAPNRPGTWGAKVGMVNLQMQSNLLIGALPQNNIDDVASANDTKVTGQPIRCGADVNNDGWVDTLPLQDAFELWNAVPDDTNGTIPASESQLPDTEYPASCDPTGKTANHACAPRAVRKLPQPILTLETAMGLSPASRVSRAYGIAKLPIVGGISSNLDVNFLVYSLHSKGVDGYLSVTLIQYPGLPLPDPTYSNYNPLSQTVQTCPPYWTEVTISGVTAVPDFNEDTKPDLSVTPQLNRLVVCGGPGCGTYDYSIETSMAADYDGDNRPAYADRCDTDPASGSDANDTDGDTLTGTCDTNGEGTNPKVDVWNSKPPWDTGQDVDGDGYMNYVDNCPTTPDSDTNNDGHIDYQQDADGDTVGNLCDPAPSVPGDGRGYPSPSPGMFVDYDDICRDPWTVGQSETSGDGGRQCLKQNGVITGWEDSNDDGVPDYLDMTSLPGGRVLADCDSNSDGDSLVDAVEAAPGTVRPCAPAIMTYGKGTDPLDASSPAAWAVGGIAEPELAESDTAAERSGGPNLSILTLVASLAGGTLLLVAGGWYSHRRRS